MPNYTELISKELRLRWTEIMGRPTPHIGHSLIIKYLLWHEQERILEK